MLQTGFPLVLLSDGKDKVEHCKDIIIGRWAFFLHSIHKSHRKLRMLALLRLINFEHANL